MRKLPLPFFAAAALVLAACAPAEAPEELAEGVEEISHCESVRADREADSIAISALPLEQNALEAAVRSAVERHATGQGRVLQYERACSAFVSDEDQALRELVGRYLDVNQNGLGGIMVRTLDFEDAVVPLREGSAHIFRRQLRGGVIYRLLGACDNECGDVDLIVMNAAGQVIGQDVLIDNFPVVELTPEADGEVLVALYLHTCSIEPCYAGMRVLEFRANWALEPFAATLTLGSGNFPDPHFVDVQAGGDVDMQRRQSSCAGFISERPDVRVNFTAGEQASPLLFSVHAQADTTLVINGPDGLWYCDDDGGVRGFNPLVVFEQPPSGQYDIWVGAYGEENVLHPARLSVSQHSSQ